MDGELAARSKGVSLPDQLMSMSNERVGIMSDDFIIGYWTEESPYGEAGEAVWYSDAEDRIEEIMDELYDEVSVGDLSWTAGRVVREMDPVAFRCIVADDTSTWESEGWITEEEPADDSGEEEGE